MDHVDDLVAAATGDRSTFTFAQVPDDTSAMVAYVAKAIAAREAGEQYPFATYGVDVGRLVGSTRFYDIHRWDWSNAPSVDGSDGAVHRPAFDTVNIGYTWLDPMAQRTPVNTEAKLLMLTHAFDRWAVRAVRIQTDVRNQRSRRAIERLGAQLDGVLRAERPATDGSVRDTAVYTMLADEWPRNRDRLVARLSPG
jgi:RimJ/RimL family protein N-acetyltransferase